MPFYASADQLYHCFEPLFARLQAESPDAAQAVHKSRLVFRFVCARPNARITINGRHNPPQASFGPSALTPDLEVELAADTLHQILLGELSLRQALAANAMAVKGPAWKSFILAPVFEQGKRLYPQVLREQGLVG
ncbi:MAG: SCP2 sterol-binding domain-containing protein [Anaerolineae bacterium]